MRSFLIFASLCFAVPAFAMTLPECAGGVEIGNAKIVRVEKNGAFILNDGRAVMLEGIRLPLADGGPPGLAQDALSQLRALAMAGALTLAAIPPKQDRYDRIRAQAFSTSSDFWLQTELLRRGLARVQIAPDRQECAADFYKAEQEARTGNRGLWAFPGFALRQADAVPVSDEGSFQIVEGKVVNAANHDGRVFLDFSMDYRRGFSVTIAPEDHKAFRKMNPKPEELAGHTIRLRGMVEDFGGRPEIALSNPSQIELIP
ncbi:MAG TPA: thermonuclease family protein [Rhizomicrobium sp.]|jgi:micrococcal nuclease|nr:thermonuclease family protein [Rhizomicrobium sp.]